MVLLGADIHFAPHTTSYTPLLTAMHRFHRPRVVGKRREGSHEFKGGISTGLRVAVVDEVIA